MKPLSIDRALLKEPFKSNPKKGCQIPWEGLAHGGMLRAAKRLMEPLLAHVKEGAEGGGRVDGIFGVFEFRV